MPSALGQPRLLPEYEPLFPAEERIARYRVHVCRGPNCSLRNSEATLLCFEEEIRVAGLEDEIEVLATSCRDRCDYGPSVNIFPGPTFYAAVDCAAVSEIVEQHLKHDQPVARFQFDTSRPGRKR